MSRHTRERYTEAELWSAVRQERAKLIAERRVHAGRLREIDNRLAELDKAEAILEGHL
ncbi:hypothetical protein J4U01_gp003 [Mycobacterium phage Kumao]|uniref:Uncharacterized protein n=1 Tax=Mycobacterium phage Kumao TaxID=2041344 RepID=A0A2D1GPJ0_9CAUD|nr:hypothetical protein J4U01_gp003 [Mycobacterium phage Kumao]ATN93966.1 hypothetical protein SEA_KUMAO_3 [Mycobacterium phage Kumao]